MKTTDGQLANPFPGLRPFRSDEHHLFFGREEQTAALLQLLRTNRFLAVVGTSGSGKSSLVRAGMIAALHGGTVTQAGSTWEAMILRPGGSPIENLARAFVDAALYDPRDANTLPRLLATLNRSRFGLVEAMKQSELFTPHPPGEGPGVRVCTNLLIVVDQFEELFRFRQQGIGSEESAAAFVNLLLAASEQTECPIYVTVTMRSDYLGDCSQIPGLAEAVNEGEYLIPRLGRDQKRDAIEKPIGVGGVKIAPLLVQRLLNEVGDDPDQLPVLQHALMRMWDAWGKKGANPVNAAGQTPFSPNRPIDFDDLEATGGLASALSNHADEIYAALPDERHRLACEKIFKALTEKGTDNRGIRRPTRLAQLRAIAASDNGTVTTVLDAFCGSGVTFLMPGTEVDLSDRTVVDLSHESLMRGWQRLRGWVEEEAQSARVFRRLLDTARLWDEGKAGLFRDPDLQVALSWRDQEVPTVEWAEQYGGHLQTALGFLETSQAEAEAERQAKETARQRELRQAQELAESRKQRLIQQQRAAQRLRKLVVGLILVAVLAGLACVAALVANKKANDAQQQAVLERDKSRQVSADLALDKGIALAEAGHADRGLLWMLAALKAAPEDADTFKRMIRWNLGAWLGQTHKPLRFIDVGGGYGWCALSPDGKSFATGNHFSPNSISKPISLWDIATGRKLTTLPGVYAPFTFRPDGKAIIAYADESRLMAIELATGRVLWMTPPLPESQVGVGFSADGSTVLVLHHHERSGVSGSASLYRLNVLTGKDRAEPLRGWASIAVAPGGNLAAVGRTENGEAYIDLVELPSGRRTASLRTGATDLHQLVFSPDGKSLYVVARKGDPHKLTSYSGRIWDLRTHREISPLLPHTNYGTYTPSADRLVTRTEDLLLVRDATGRVRGSGFPLGNSDPWDRNTYPGADGRTMLAFAPDFTVRLWEISAEAQPVPDKQATLAASAPSTARSRGYYVFEVGLRADGQIAVSRSVDAAGREQVRLSDPTSGRPFGVPARHHPGWFVRAYAFSADGRSFATGSNPPAAAGELRLWDTSTGGLLVPPIPLTNYVSALAFHPNGKFVASGDFSGLVRIWDTSTGREIGRPLPQGEIVLALSFSPDGKILAVGLAKDRTGKPGIRLWDVATRQPIGELLPSTNNVDRIEFRPDGRALLASTDQSTQLWDTTQGRALTEPLIDEEIGGFRPDGRAFLTVGGDGSVKIRDATTGRVLGRPLTSSSRANCAAFRGDGGLVAAGFEDGAVRLCDPATNQPVGPPRFMRHAVVSVAFTPEGRSVAAIDEAGESRTWPVPEPLDGNIDDLTLRIEARTGLRMETGLAISRLTTAAWQERLDQLGRLDPSAAGPDTDPAWHEPMTLEAEQTGNAFAAVWHLDRLIAARAPLTLPSPPKGRGQGEGEDWFLYARRGRARSLSDQFDKAADDFRKAERLSSRDRVLDFETHCVLDCTKAKHWTAALWYLDRLLAARPKDGSLHLERAAVYGKLGRGADRKAEMARVFELGAGEGVVIPRAEELGKAGRWSEAAKLLTRCGRRGPLSQQLAQAWAIACLQAKDYAGYREACAAVLACQGPDPTVVFSALSAADVFAMGPKGLGDYRVPIRWMESRLSAVPAPRPLFKHLFSNVLGGLLLRAGRLDEAIVRINEGIAAAKAPEIPTDWTYLALAYARKGQRAEARRTLQRLRDWRPDSSMTFWDLQEVTLLRNEAESLLASTGKRKK